MLTMRYKIHSYLGIKVKKFSARGLKTGEDKRYFLAEVHIKICICNTITYLHNVW
jgi:hypothetical protein